jgi:hypothetical protein
MGGIADGWNIGELHRGFGKLVVNLAVPAVDAVMAIDFATKMPDATANPSGLHIGYTDAGWEFATNPTFDEIKVDEEAEGVSDFITTNEATITGAMRQVRNLSKLSTMLPGSVYTAPTGTPTQIEKVTGGGLATVGYFCAALIWPDDDDDAVVWWVMLYRCLNRGGLKIALGRTKDSAADVTLTGRAVSGRTAGDRVFAIVRAEDVTP